MRAYSRMLTDIAESRPASVTAYYFRVMFGECLRQCVQYVCTVDDVASLDARYTSYKTLRGDLYVVGELASMCTLGYT